MNMKKMIWAWLGCALLIAAVIVVGVVWMMRSRLNNTNTISSNSTNAVVNTNVNIPVNVNVTSNVNTNQPAAKKSTLIASMQGLQSGLGFRGDKNLESLAQKSWLSFLESDSFDTYLANVKSAQQGNAALIKTGPFYSNRDVVGEFVWNVVEPKDGEFDWTMPDAAMQAAGNAGIEVSAVVQPFSSWGSAETVPVTRCVGIDFVFMDYQGGLPTDLQKYQRFLTALVERYDGDGVDDMPGLTTRVADWEVGNEYEGPCSGNLNQAANYLTLLKASYSTIKQADSKALVLNAGALEIADGRGHDIPDTINFWNEFFKQGGADYLDIFNIHYNHERNEPTADLSGWQKDIDFFRDLLDGVGKTSTPMWVTEFGTFGGTIQTPPRPDGQAGTTYTHTDAEQASWYFRTMVTGMADKTERFFIDLSGPNGSGIGSSSWFTPNGQAREFSKTVTGLATQVEGYTSAGKVTDGQYKFVVNGKTAYALWAGELPAEISGTVTVMALDGTISQMNASSISYSEAAPVLVLL